MQQNSNRLKHNYILHIYLVPILRVSRILIVFLFLATNVLAQEIKGKVISDFNNEPVSDCNIRINGTTTGTISDSSGEFILEYSKLPLTLFVSHISYEDQYIKLEKAEKDLRIVLQRKSYVLDSITILSDPVVNIVKDKPLYIWDYEFFENKIIVLAFLDNSMFKPRLILLNDYGDTLCVKPVKKARRFYKDCLDNVHLIGVDEVHQIYYDSKDLNFAYSYPLSVIQSILNPCVEYLSGYFYLNQYYNDDQILRYYFVEENTKEYNVLSTISDSLGLVHLLDEERFASMGSYNGFDNRFAKLFFYNPVFAPLSRIDSAIYIFNYSNNVLERYNDKGECVKTIDITYHHNKNWKEELLVDEVLGKAYTVFMKNGRTAIYEIDISTGYIGEPIIIPEFTFVEKCKIKNGYLYFLYKERSMIEYKKLYRMKI